MALLSMITGAEAILEPLLSSFAADDALLLKNIKAASAQIQNYLGWVMSAAEVAALEEDLKLGCAKLVAHLTVGSTNAVGFQQESLGSYSYNFGRGRPVGSFPVAVLDLIDAYIRHTAPIPVAVE